MRIASVFFSLMTLLLLSCNKEKEVKSISSDALNPISESEVKITVKDYWEESISIKTEAKEIISRAKEINCSEAAKYAENVIMISSKAEKTNNLITAEHFIEEASQTLIQAEDAITYCEDKDEISFATDLKNE